MLHSQTIVQRIGMKVWFASGHHCCNVYFQSKILKIATITTSKRNLKRSKLLYQTFSTPHCGVIGLTTNRFAAGSLEHFSRLRPAEEPSPGETWSLSGSIGFRSGGEEFLQVHSQLTASWKKGPDFEIGSRVRSVQFRIWLFGPVDQWTSGV